jgi:hydrogenase expression/formation protein HypD
MRYLDEYRDAEAARRLAARIDAACGRPWTIMEVCGGQTHAIVRFGIDELLPARITLVHGPGCPVCVTPVDLIDKAMEIAARPGVVLASFGDMLRVPGSNGDLLSVKAQGGDVRMIYSPMDALALAEALPGREVVLFAVGFETTAPANAMAAAEALRRDVRNFSLLVSHVLVPPAMEAILSAPGSRVQGFLAAGHVCTIMGASEYEALARRHRVPIVITGFEPVDILDGILRCVTQLEEGRAEVENAYARAVREEGNRPARDLVAEVFRIVDRTWRGIGEIARSGLALSERYAGLDAELRFGAAAPAAPGRPARDAGECISGLVLQGLKKPRDCPAFGAGCTPDHPLGATMVSAEGACSAYWRHRREAADA